MPSEKLDKKSKKRKALVEPLQPLNNSEQATLDNVFHKLLGKNKALEIESALNNPSTSQKTSSLFANQANTPSPTINEIAQVYDLPLGDNKDKVTTSDNMTTLDKMATVVNSNTSPQPMATVDNLTREDKTTTADNMTTLDKMATVVNVTEVKGDLRIPNTVVDSLFPILDITASMVYLRLYRLSYGYHKDICTVGLEKLAKSINSSERTVQRAIERLEALGLIERQGAIFGGQLKGNIFKVRLPGTLDKMTTLDNMTPIKSDDHDDLKRQDHHQTEHEKSVMMIYQQTTGNLWSKADGGTYNKIKNIPLQAIEMAIKLATQRASSRPNSLAYFVKEIIATANPPKQNRSQRKKALEKIVQQVRNSFIGSNYSMSDFTYKVKDLCLRDDIAFDNDIFDEVMNKKNG